MWLDVNGKSCQTGSTSTMIFNIAKCISYVSTFLALLPGDIITTVPRLASAPASKPPQFLDVGDVVTLGIEGLGEQRQEIIARQRCARFRNDCRRPACPGPPRVSR